MGCLIEFLIELLLEGLSDAAGHPRVPIFIRLIFITLLVGGMAVVAVLCGFSALDAVGLAGAVIGWVIAAGLIFLWVYGCYRIIKTRRTNNK